MAVKLVTTIKEYTGLSTDIKPTDVSIGSTYFEYNTKARYITYDGTNWKKTRRAYIISTGRIGDTQ